MFRFLILITIICFSLAQTDGYPRQEHIDIEHYYFNLELSDETDLIKGEGTIIIINNDLSKDIFIDLQQSMNVSKISIDGGEILFNHSNNRISIQQKTLENKYLENKINLSITYSGRPEDGLIISKNKYGNRTYFGDNWPNRAHHWLPTIDHPYDKAKVTWHVTAPAKYQVVANGLQIERSTIAENRVLTVWEQSVPISTKVMVIGVAEFAMKTYRFYNIDEKKDYDWKFHDDFSERRIGCGDKILHYDLNQTSFSIQSWVYPDERESGFRDYSLSIHTILYFSKVIGPYPYEKLANVQSKTRYGGMENASNIFYHENSIDGKGGAETLIAHEVAHQWFGNSATEDDWHHVWLSEGFATYMTHMYMEHRKGKNELRNRLKIDLENIKAFHRTNPKRSLIDTSIKNYNDVLNTYAYQKGSWVLHMLREKIGTDKFTETLKTYYTTFRDSNAVTDDFIRIAEDVASEELTLWFHQWLYYPDNPNLTIDVAVEGKVLVVNVTQETENIFDIDLEMVLESGEESRKIVLEIDKKTMTFGFDIETAPERISLDPDVKLLFGAKVNYK